MKKEQKIVIVGGVAGGASAAARLRRLDESAEIIIFERGEYISFANCGLPYYIGGEIKDKSELTLQTPESFHARFNVDVRNFSEVILINKEDKTIIVKNHITGESYTESYDKVILSMGANPIKPPIEGINLKNVFTLRNIPDTYKIKEQIESERSKKAVVVGGGYIGIEMAENLKATGLDVSVVEMSNQVIAPLDYDMACDVHKYIKSKGVNLLLETKLKAIEEKGNGLSLDITDESGAKNSISCDIMILAIGVTPETQIANQASLELTPRGNIITNDFMVTSDENIYAVGDAVQVTDFVTGEKLAIPLAGPANKQGRIAADQIASECNLAFNEDSIVKSSYSGTQGTTILKVFDMTVATTGINEKTAIRLGLNYEKSFTYSSSHATYYPGSNSMSIKTIFEKVTGKILGAQIVGFDGVDKRCDVFATAIRFGAKADDLTKLELCYAPPFSSAKDPVNMVGFVIENILTNKVKIFHWDDIKSLPRDGSITLIDVRTKGEYARGHIDGFINIPVDELRENIDKLDHKKDIYVNCHSGQRSYIACRILMQNGFNAYNLSGGYRLFDSIFN